MNLATSLRNPKAPCDPVYAPVPDPRVSRASLVLVTTSAGNIDRTSGWLIPYSPRSVRASTCRKKVIGACPTACGFPTLSKGQRNKCEWVIKLSEMNHWYCVQIRRNDILLLLPIFVNTISLPSALSWNFHGNKSLEESLFTLEYDLFEWWVELW